MFGTALLSAVPVVFVALLPACGNGESGHHGRVVGRQIHIGILAFSVLGGAMAILLAACSVPFIGSDSEPFIGSDSEEETRAQERERLVAFYNATGGPDWRYSARWLSDQPLENWGGILYFSSERSVGLGGGTVTEGGVTGIKLETNGLKGQIPSELGHFRFLSQLWLGGNQLSGEIPSELGNLDSLTHLHLGGNQLSGEIPSELGKPRSLSYLYLGGNQLTGEIPSELENLKGLIALDLSNNLLTGTIPEGLGRVRRFSYLDLSGNQLTGEIPSRLEMLHRLDLSDNDLTGKIPSRFGGMRELYLGGNRLSGCIPSGLRSTQENDFLNLGLSFLPEARWLRWSPSTMPLAGKTGGTTRTG